MFNRKTQPRLYKIWVNIRQRCRNKNCPDYRYYGGKGISICEEWDDFNSFASWSLEHGYDKNLTIDRIKSNEGYEPDNCRWITQSKNSKLMNESYLGGNPRCKMVKCIENGKVYNSVSEAAKAVNGTTSNIISMLNGRSKTSYGYTWKWL